MLKYELIPGQLKHEGIITDANLVAPQQASLTTVHLTHEEEYVNRLLQQTLSAKEQREIGFPQSPELTVREFKIAQGSLDAALSAASQGCAFNVAGGTHHAFANKGEGFCMLNDFAVAANFLLHNGLASKIMIVDLDVHQGNGTASLFANRPEVFTLSMHGERNYPFRKVQSDLDVGLPDGIEDADYLYTLKTSLNKAIQSLKPDIVLYQSGVDVLATDKFGKLSLSLSGCRQRDEMVFGFFEKKNIPVIAAMGGGYSPDIRHITEAHCNTFKAGKAIYGL